MKYKIIYENDEYSKVWNEWKSFNSLKEVKKEVIRLKYPLPGMKVVMEVKP